MGWRAGLGVACLCLGLTAGPVWAETVVAKRTIRSQAVLAADDIDLRSGVHPGAAARADQVVGLETRVILYAGRPILLSQLAPPALVERNAPVRMIYETAGLRIVTEGRALGRAGLGEMVRVMNLASRSTLTARVTGPGDVVVSNLPPSPESN